MRSGLFYIIKPRDKDCGVLAIYSDGGFRYRILKKGEGYFVQIKNGGGVGGSYKNESEFKTLKEAVDYIEY